MPLIFQYGSNCETTEINKPTRLAGRAKSEGRAQTVGEFEIAFNKWSQNRGCAAADLIRPENGGRRIWGVLFQVSDSDLTKLAEEVEGPSYMPIEIEVEDPAAVAKTVTTFVVREDRRRDRLWTSAEYVEHIVRGLRDHEVPDDYIQHVIDVAVRSNGRALQAADEQTRRIELLRSN